jgi:hypothetical protein
VRKQIYLDCDGVLADFETAARAIFGMSSDAFEEQRGVAAFWKALAHVDGFFEHLAPMPDAMQLYDAVRDRSPIILTGMPEGKWAEPQKRAWAAKHFPGVPVIATMAVMKREHCEPGDVLVDDRDQHRKLWEDAGGRFIHHTSAASSIVELRAAGYIT